MGKYTFYKKWFLAAAIYNLFWGMSVILIPNWYFDLIDLSISDNQAIWQVVGMCIFVYAPGYWWASKDPVRFRHYILIGLLGKVLGPIGFVWSVFQGILPLKFGLTLIFNDLIWWPVFILFLITMAKQKDGWLVLIRGD